MYLVTGLGQLAKGPQKSPKGGKKAAPRRGQRRPVRPQTSPFPDQIVGTGSEPAILIWRLNVPFRKDFEAFRQEVKKRMGLHYIKEGKGPHRDNTNSESNDQILKAYHNYALKHDPPMREYIDSVTVKAMYWFIQEDESNRSRWVILQP